MGYNKQIQKSMKLYHQFPVAISYLCLTYYHEYDHFVEVENDNIFEINDAKNKITIVTIGGWCNIDGKMNIIYNPKLPLIYSWTFKVTKTAKISRVFIGMEIDDAYTSSRTFEDGDIVKMVLDTQKNEIKYIVNDKNKGCKSITFEEIHLRILLSSKGTSIKLIKFEKTLPSKNRYLIPKKL